MLHDQSTTVDPINSVFYKKVFGEPFIKTHQVPWRKFDIPATDTDNAVFPKVILTPLQKYTNGFEGKTIPRASILPWPLKEVKWAFRFQNMYQPTEE